MLDLAIAMPVVAAPAAPAQATAPEAPGAFAQELEQASAKGKAEPKRSAAEPPDAASDAANADASDADAAQAAALDLAALLASLQNLQPPNTEPQMATSGEAGADDRAGQADDTGRDAPGINALPINDPAAPLQLAPLEPQALANAPAPALDPLPDAALPAAAQAARAAAGLPATGAAATEPGASAVPSALDADTRRPGSADSDKPIKNIRPMPVEPGTTSLGATTPRDAPATTPAMARLDAPDAATRRAAVPADPHQRAEPAASLATPLPQSPAAAAAGTTLLTSPAAAGGTSAPFQAMLNAAVGSPEFAPALGTQVSMLARDGIAQASLHLHPAELGPIAVQIELTGRHAQVNMSAEHALTRQALEQALPALAGALRDAGLTLTGGGVFQQPQHAQRGPQGDARSPSGRGVEVDDLAADAAAPLALAGALPRPRIQRGALDLYA